MVRLSILLLFLGLQLNAQDFTIGPSGDFATLTQAAASLQPGDSVMFLNGVHGGQTQFVNDLNGTANLPITIYAEARFEVIFQGGTEALHFINCSHLILDGFVIQGQSGNGINIDDGGDYSTPTHHIEMRYCWFRDMPISGNTDFLKLSGLDSFHIHHCRFIDGGDGGSGIDMVGCHDGVIEDNWIERAGTSGIQAKGGTQFITIRRNFLKDLPQRALNLGGSTGLQFFRPPLPNPIQDAFEAADLDVYSNIFVGSRSPIAYVGCVRVHVYNNTIYHPDNWVIRILQETRVPGFLTCADNSFRSNIIIQDRDLTEINIGPETAASTFRFTHNLWFNEDNNNWSPILPVTDSFQIIGDPLLADPASNDFHLGKTSRAIGTGWSLPDSTLDYDGELFLDPPSRGALEKTMTTSTVQNQWQEYALIRLSNSEFYVQNSQANDRWIISTLDGKVIREITQYSTNEIVEFSNIKPSIYLISIYRNNYLIYSSQYPIF